MCPRGKMTSIQTGQRWWREIYSQMESELKAELLCTSDKHIKNSRFLSDTTRCAMKGGRIGTQSMSIAFYNYQNHKSWMWNLVLFDFHLARLEDTKVPSGMLTGRAKLTVREFPESSFPNWGGFFVRNCKPSGIVDSQWEFKLILQSPLRPQQAKEKLQNLSSPFDCRTHTKSMKNLSSRPPVVLRCS